MITDDEELAEGVRLLRDHGRQGRDNHTVVGVNSRLDGLQAAILAAKLPHVERWNEARREIAGRYRASCSTPSCSTGPATPSRRPSRTTCSRSSPTSATRSPTRSRRAGS